MFMESFSLFDKLNATPVEIDPKTDFCQHTVLVTEQSMLLCYYCGSEVNRETKYDGYMPNQTHCYTRKNKEKSIYLDVQNLDISDHIKDIANDIYLEACKEKIHRGNKRKAIVFASVFHAYKLDKNPQSCETLIRVFNINRKDALKGLKFINENLSKNSPIRTLYITPEHLIREFLENFQITEQNQAEIVDLYHQIRNRSTAINRSRPQSVASGVIWYWVKLNQKQLNIKDFVKRVVLSELTVIKMAKEVGRIRGREDVV
jgi:transcription initiation factor TFIIIB Brf1 subunit/transcription initiation factor TFIIB